MGGTDSDTVSSYCGVYGGKGTAYEADGPEADYDTWRTARIELNPETAQITFLIDGQPVGDYTPPEAEALKRAEFTVELQIYFETGTGLTGYFDDVSIGP